MSITDFKKQVVSGLQQLQESVRMVSRLEAFRQVYEKTDRILSGRPIRVIMAFDGDSHGLGDAPGWTDGEDISLNANVINRDLGHLTMPMIVLHTKAINFHELGHIMFTPRMSDDTPKWVKAQSIAEPGRKWWYAFNALEDQRMEMMFTAKFRPAINYFEAIALKWLVNNGAFLAESYILVYGRKFLPANIIATCRAAYVARYGELLCLRAETIIDKYLTVIFPSGSLVANARIRDYVQLLEEMKQVHPYSDTPTPTLISADNGGATGNPDVRGPGAIKKGQAKVKDQLDAADGMDDVEPRPPKTKKEPKDLKGSNTEDDDDSDADNEDGEGAEGDEGDDEDDGDDGDTDGGNAGSGQSSQDTGGETPGQGAGNDPTPVSGTQPTVTEQLDAVYDALDELFQDEEFAKELNDTARAVQAIMNGEGVAVGVDTPSTMTSVRPEVVGAARNMTKVLTRLRTELEETRSTRQMAGGIDVRRFLTRKPWEMDFYQNWDPGLDEETNLEAVIMVDLSGSMASTMREVSESLWAVKRSMQALDSRVTVLGFSEQSFVLYQPTEKVDPTRMRLFGARSSTIPDGALQEAHRLLVTSNRSQKLLVSITDGDWQGNRRKQDDTVKALNGIGVVTVCIGIGAAPNDAHLHSVFHHLRDIRQMPVIATGIVAESLKSLSTQMQHT